MASSLAKAPAMSSQPPTKQVNIWRCDVCNVASFRDFDEACRHEEECRKQKEAEEQAKLHPFFQQSKKRKTTATETNSNAAAKPTTTKASNGKKKSKTKESTKAKATKKEKKHEASVEPSKQVIELTDSPNVQAFASMFARDEKTFLAEQRAAEFQAKRRMQQQKEKSTASIKTAPSKTTLSSGKTQPPLALLFPNPSHIFPSGSSESKIPEASYQWLTDDMLESARAALQVSHHSDGHDEKVISIEDNNEYQSILPPPASALAQQMVEKDPLQQALASLLIPPSKLPADTKLWSDKYSIQNVPNDICGTSLRTAAKQMQDFVEQWMVERHKANERAAEKQRALRRAKKKKAKKASSSYKDDDLWADSDDEESRLTSLFLLTGPVGCGKSSIVHAVARECGCEILEINTSEKRGAAAIRRTLEEATQSHSSLDMLKKREANFFAAKELVDSDEEPEGKGSSLTVILIDEADNLYEPQGDNGFWSALSDLTKRAKCPIFLTANVVPNGILASSFRFEHVDIELPKPAECIPKMQQIIKKEGFAFRTDKASCTNEKLELIADFCDCDLRRIALELQLFASSSHNLNIDSEQETEPPSEALQDTACNTGADRSGITIIRPQKVAPDSYSLLSIEGSGFLELAVPPGLGSGGYPVDVFVGDQKCPQARIMDDSTIVAVCSPLMLPPNVDVHGNYRGTHCRSLKASYRPVTISSISKTGILSTTQGMVSPTELPDGSRFTVVATARNIECHFPPAPGFMEYYFTKSPKPSDESRADKEDSDEEFELEDDRPPAKVVSQDCQTPRQTQEEDWKLVAQLLKEGIDAWHSTHGEVPSLANDTKPDKYALEQLEHMSTERSLQSDAAVFEEVGSAGVPHLSGACRGFGFDLTEAYPKFTNEKSKPPSEERLFTLGWKDNCGYFGTNESYMSLPAALLDRRLLKRTESAARGLSLSSVEDFEPPEDDEECKGMTFGRCEEDMFLFTPTPTSILSLPTFLRRARGSSNTCYPTNDDNLLERKMLSHWEKAIQLAADYVFPSTIPKMFSRGLSRAMDPILPNRQLIDSALFLDFLPILRCMALHERAAEHVFVQTHAADPEFAATLSNRQRSTRRSRKLGREHYLVKISPTFQRQESDLQSAKQIGAVLAESALVY